MDKGLTTVFSSDFSPDYDDDGKWRSGIKSRWNIDLWRGV
jgi:hypothetical protein